jgi:putative FmdB family regulatory protein
MPRYEFYCASCGQTFEKGLPLEANHTEVRCPSCHHRAQRIYTAPMVMFKGSGFYVTDHRSASSGKTKS